jgi:hypothetical protein
MIFGKSVFLFKKIRAKRLKIFAMGNGCPLTLPSPPAYRQAERDRVRGNLIESNNTQCVCIRSERGFRKNIHV